MLADIFERKPMTLVSGSINPLPVVAADSIFQDCQKQGPLGAEFFSAVCAGIKLDIEGVGAQGRIHPGMEDFDISAIGHRLNLGENWG